MLHPKCLWDPLKTFDSLERLWFCLCFFSTAGASEIFSGSQSNEELKTEQSDLQHIKNLSQIF